MVSAGYFFLILYEFCNPVVEDVGYFLGYRHFHVNVKVIVFSQVSRVVKSVDLLLIILYASSQTRKLCLNLIQAFPFCIQNSFLRVVLHPTTTYYMQLLKRPIKQYRIPRRKKKEEKRRKRNTALVIHIRNLK